MTSPIADPDQRNFELTNEEVIALARAAEVPMPQFIDRATVDGWDAEVLFAVTSAGIRSLVARDFVRMTDDILQVPAPLAQLIQCVSQPGLVAETRAVSGAQRELVLFYALSEWSIGHRPARLGNHRFTLFSTDHLFEVLVATSGLEKTHGYDASVSLGGDIELADLLNRSDPKRDQSVGDRLTHALTSTDSIGGSIAVVHGGAEGEIRGGELAWVLTENGALVIVEIEADENGTSYLKVRPSTPVELMSEARSLLPT